VAGSTLRVVVAVGFPGPHIGASAHRFPIIQQQRSSIHLPEPVAREDNEQQREQAEAGING
jgi:hypothetical protein